MPVGVQLDFKGATLEQYDDVLETTGFLPGGPTGPRALFHWVTKTEDGIRIVDVWDSVEAFEDFIQTRDSDAFADAGAPEADTAVRFIRTGQRKWQASLP